MRHGEAFIASLLDTDDALMHYASKYYDPAKAREYYLRTRKLKGRKKSLTSDAQKEAWAVTSDQISTQSKAAADKHKKTVEDIRSQQAKVKEAQVARVEKLRATAEAARKKIVDNLKSRLEALDTVELPIPENASPKRRAYLEEQRARQKKSARAAAQKDMQKLSKSLRSALDGARRAYANSQNALRAKYNSENEAYRKTQKQFSKDRETEYENIRTQIK